MDHKAAGTKIVFHLEGVDPQLSVPNLTQLRQRHNSILISPISKFCGLLPPDSQIIYEIMLRTCNNYPEFSMIKRTYHNFAGK